MGAICFKNLLEASLDVSDVGFHSRPMNRIPRWVRIVGLLVLLAVVGVAIWIARQPPAPAWPEPPSPNGYPRVLQLGARLQQEGWPPADSEGHPDPASGAPPEYVVAEARAALALPCAVPSQPTMAYVDQHLIDLAALKRVAQALFAQGKIELESGQTNACALLGLDLLRLAQAAKEHGLLIDAMIAHAAERMGCDLLVLAAPGMSADTLGDALERLAAVEPILTDSQAVTELEDQFFRRNMPLLPRLIFRIQELAGSSLLAKSRAAFIAKHDAATVGLRRTQLWLAARVYELEHGRPPASAAELVPGVLSVLPVDPATKSPLALPALPPLSRP